jgi:endonuclease YncB( thermonuclease family)
MRLRRRPSFGGPVSILFFAAVGALLVTLLMPYWDQFAAKNAKGPTIIGAPRIEVIDGDTIRANGQTYRLVGYDAPETGLNAKCESERRLAARATSRLRQIVAFSESHVPAHLAPRAHKDAITVGSVPCFRCEPEM